MDQLFADYWKKNKEVLTTLGVSEKVACVIFSNGMAAAGEVLTNSALKNFLLTTNS